MGRPGAACPHHARIAIDEIAGNDPRAEPYAEQSSLSRETVQTQLARLFDKTGHARQTDLVCDALRKSPVESEKLLEQLTTLEMDHRSGLATTRIT